MLMFAKIRRFSPWLLLAFAAPLQATTLQAVGQFNAYAISSFNYQSTDIEGMIGSGGDVTYVGGDVGRNNVSSPYSIYSGGNVLLQGHAVKNGGIQANGSVTTTDVGIGGGINSGGNVSITRGSMAAGSTIVNNGSLSTSNFAVQGNVLSQGNVTVTTGSINGDINSGGNVLTSKVGVNGNINALGNIEIKEGSSVVGNAFRANGNYRTNNHALKSDVHVGGTFTGVSGSVSGVIEAYGGVGAGNTFWLDPNKHLLGPSKATLPSVTIDSHVSAAIDHFAIAQAIIGAGAEYAAMNKTADVVQEDNNPSVDNYILRGKHGLNVFDVDASMLSKFASIRFEGFDDSTFIVNVSGSVVDIVSPGGFQFVGMDETNVLFNMNQAELVKLSGSFYGTILAANADVHTAGNGTIFGGLYADNISGSSQINSRYFRGEDPTEVPLPATWILFAFGLLGLMRLKRNAA
ncbi:MAG: choice-of-anchor A family protein [Gammaproteobacteria bacterium]|nr:choice-of-anchor A family protein [Gammaproteobacteria bacterium]